MILFLLFSNYGEFVKSIYPQNPSLVFIINGEIQTLIISTFLFM